MADFISRAAGHFDAEWSKRLCLHVLADFAKSHHLSAHCTGGSFFLTIAYTMTKAKVDIDFDIRIPLLKSHA